MPIELEPPMHAAPLSLSKDVLEAAASRLSQHYEHEMCWPACRDYAYIMVHLVREVRLNLCAPRASFVPGRSPEELSRLCVLAHATTVAFVEAPALAELTEDWETLSRAMAASIGPRTVYSPSAITDSSPTA